MIKIAPVHHIRTVVAVLVLVSVPLIVQAKESREQELLRKLEERDKVILELLKRDEKMAASSKGKDVVMQYTIKDTGTVFFMSFVDGVVDAGMGAPSVEAHVKLKMDADIFDGMMTGRVNGNRAAMQGKLSFSGDTRKAMSLMRFQKGMGNAYKIALDEIGDPGDLTRIGEIATEPQVVASFEDQHPVHEQVSAPTVVRVGDIRDEILGITNEMYAKGLITATGGNISAAAFSPSWGRRALLC